MAENKLSSSCRLLVIGGSAGSLDVLLQVLPRLSPELPFPVVVVLHRKSTGESTLEYLLNTKTALRVKEAEDKERLEAGTIYVAPADYHLLIERGNAVSLDYSEKLHFCRPAIDPTFETAADVLGSSLACLLLSGANADGAEGLQMAAAAGAQVLVQAPQTAHVPFMPLAGLSLVKSARLLTIEEMAPAINSL